MRIFTCSVSTVMPMCKFITSFNINVALSENTMSLNKLFLSNLGIIVSQMFNLRSNSSKTKYILYARYDLNLKYWRLETEYLFGQQFFSRKSGTLLQYGAIFPKPYYRSLFSYVFQKKLICSRLFNLRLIFKFVGFAIAVLFANLMLNCLTLDWVYLGNKISFSLKQVFLLICP